VYSTFDADLALIGTPSASTLSGVVTLRRASISERADLPLLLAQMSQPAVATTAQNAYLNSVQLDVRIGSDPNFTLNSALASNVEVDVDLRLRGSPERPSLQGSVQVNRGEMQVFGNRYTVDRGDIRFLNPLRIEPSFDIDLTTRVRGHTVNVSFSGTPESLKYNLSSDPPLQQSEVIALLAVGRDPTSSANQIAPGAGTSGLSTFADLGGGLLGQAVSQQVSNRAQRFFGATRVKIDPTLTGVDNLPQARLTFEQQVSKNITLTYITNLNRTTEQIVRFQWDFSPEWSAIGVRDQNGLLGVDFQFRKRF
jgi:translocation and assembly module TamB